MSDRNLMLPRPLAATMIESGIDTIITEDAHLRHLPGITAVNPYGED